MTTPAIHATALKKDYAGEHALAGVDLLIPSGILFGIIGADGAGKTTLMRILATLIDADSGEASVLSHRVDSQSASIRSTIGYMPQKFSLYEDLSVKENMHFFADIFGVKADERHKRIVRLLAFSRLDPFQNRRARNLSGGMKQKLALSCALIHTPQLLILDEPTTGVDPVSRKEFWSILRDLQMQGITVVVSTPYMDEAEYCDELVLLHKGRVMLQGTPKGVLDAYPLTIYKVSARSASLGLAATNKLPPEISLAYPVGGNLHVATKIQPSQINVVFDKIQSVIPEASTIVQVKPRIEDLFFYTLSEFGGRSAS